MNLKTLETALNARFQSETQGMRIANITTIGGLNIFGDAGLDKEIRKDRALIREVKGGFRYHTLQDSNPESMGFIRNDRVVFVSYED